MLDMVIHNEVFENGVQDFEALVWIVSTADSLAATRQWLCNRRFEPVCASGTQTHPYDYAYSYDSVGNRLTSSDNFGTATYAANGRNWSSKQKSGTRHCLISA